KRRGVESELKKLIKKYRHIQRSQSEMLLVLYVFDVDDMKNINNHYGYDIGDMILVEVAKRLRKHKKAKDVIARLDGDEILYISFIPNINVLPDYSHEVLAKLSAQALFIDEETELDFTCSGSLICMPFVGEPLETQHWWRYLKMAEFALNTGKNHTKRNSLFWLKNNQVTGDFMHSSLRKKELSLALDKEEITLQPLVET
ncbi:MAG: GGDEF domain-containing protein, partial [Pseudomonadota bacterium]